MAVHIPGTYADWKHCITVVCGLELSREYIEARIQALNDMNDHMTARYVTLYGEAQRQQTLQWFAQAREELA